MLVIAIVLGLLPGFAWLVFYLTEDPHPEPKRLVTLTFFAGIAFGFFAIVLEQLYNRTAMDWGIATLSVFSLLVFAIIEEAMKFGAAYFAVGKSSVLNDPLDRMLYIIVAALGFATLENIGAISNLPLASGATALIGSAFQMDSLRFVGATLLHSLTAGIVGYYWAMGIIRKHVFWNLLAGFIFAIILHAGFNYLILTYGDISYTIILLLVAGFFVLNDFEKLKANEPTT